MANDNVDSWTNGHKRFRCFHSAIHFCDFRQVIQGMSTFGFKVVLSDKIRAEKLFTGLRVVN